jgi:hypothetical protein
MAYGDGPRTEADLGVSGAAIALIIRHPAWCVVAPGIATFTETPAPLGLDQAIDDRRNA